MWKQTACTRLKCHHHPGSPRSQGSELPSICYRQGRAAGRGLLSQPRGQDPFSSEENRLSKPEPPEGFLLIHFPGPTCHNSKGLSDVQWKLRFQQVPLRLLSTPRFENPRPEWPLVGRQHQEKRKEPRKHGPASASEETCQAPETRLLFFTHGHTPGPGWPRGEGLSFMSLGVQKVCVCLFSTKPVLNWHKRNRFYK